MGMQPIQPVQAPAAMAPQPTAMDQIGQMAMGKVAGNAVDAGIGKVGTMYEGSKLQSGVNSMLGPLMGGAAESTAAMTSGAEGASAMAGMGAAMPWIGAGLLGGKMLGLFSEGGLVGPLAGIKYKSNGGEVSDEVSYSFQSMLPK